MAEEHRGRIAAVLAANAELQAVAHLAAALAGDVDQLADALAPRSDEELGRAPAAGEWSARQTLERATLIWMPGGFPSYLMHSIRDLPVADIIRARFAAGVTIGGASAGAVAMSETMLADEVLPDGRASDGGPTEAGLGLWPEAIVSPHFTERRRLAPLVPIVQQHPNLIGVGLDEGTAVLVFDGAFEVLGRGTVSVTRLTAVSRIFVETRNPSRVSRG